LSACVGKTVANRGGQDTQQAAAHVDSSEVKTSGELAEPVGEWCEATSPDGYIYYWNTVTKGETLQCSNW